MARTSVNMSTSASALGYSKVTFVNGKTLLVTHVGHTNVISKLALKDVLVVPNILNNLLSISKLTTDNNVNDLFSQPHFYVQDQLTKQVLAQGRCENGLYILNTTPQALVVLSRVSPKASFELRHLRLGNVSYDTIYLLNKSGCLSLTSLLPNLLCVHRVKWPKVIIYLSLLMINVHLNLSILYIATYGDHSRSLPLRVFDTM